MLPLAKSQFEQSDVDAGQQLMAFVKRGNH